MLIFVLVFEDGQNFKFPIFPFSPYISKSIRYNNVSYYTLKFVKYASNEHTDVELEDYLSRRSCRFKVWV